MYREPRSLFQVHKFLWIVNKQKWALPVHLSVVYRCVTRFTVLDNTRHPVIVNWSLAFYVCFPGHLLKQTTPF